MSILAANIPTHPYLSEKVVKPSKKKSSRLEVFDRLFYPCDFIPFPKPLLQAFSI